MCRSGMCLATAAYILLVLSLVACALSFVAPFWIIYNDLTANKNIFQQIGQKLGQIFTEGGAPLWTAGLWGRCNTEKTCFGFWENDYKWEKALPDWHKAAQGLFAGGLLFLLIAVAVATLHFCCCCCKKSFSIHSALGSLALAAMICMAASIAVYGGFQSKEGMLDYATFYWAYYVGIAGVVACLVSVILFFCDSCISRDHEGYHMTRVV